MKNEAFMREAIRLSLEPMRAGRGGPFGAVVVRQGTVIGRGWNQVTSTCDPTAHAEIVAIRAACAELRTFSLAGCDLYASCEPCPMCLSAVCWARLDRVFYACTREDAAASGFDDVRIFQEVALGVEQRSVPFRQLLRDEALPALVEWQHKGDKVPY